VYHKRHTGQPRVEYGDAVEEALCFGWIDSIVKRLDDNRYAQKFTPRTQDSAWSTLNRRRFAKLVSEGKMTDSGFARAPHTGRADTAERPEQRLRSGNQVPLYIRRALQAKPVVWRNFTGLAPSYRRLYVRWIDAAKKEPTRKKRLSEAIALLAQGRKLGLK
jgi:uncharacterized protein YdeI (YjbR/CyaY-like superfamily)